jgi:uncharacterized protein
MKLADTNVLLYAMNDDSPYNKQSLQWIEQTLAQPPGLALAWNSIVGFIRMSTRKGLLPSPLSVEQALAVVEDWLAHPNTHIVQPGERHADLLARLLLSVGAAGNFTNDAHLAAIAIEHHAELVSFDRDFQRFPGLKFHLLA